WSALNSFQPTLDTDSFPGFAVHPLTPLAFDAQVPKRDQRQMEAWQRIGVYAAGLALDSAGCKGNADLLGRMDMIVAAGGGERDYAVDAQILSALPKAADQDAYLNEHLLSDIRPTLFLAQLSNLLAGNISLVHGVIGSSRTFMGEEAAGTDSLSVAVRRIGAGQGDLALVGGSFNAQRPDILLHHEMGGKLWRQPFQGVWGRQAGGGGLIPGSIGCFLIIESRSHAEARGVRPIARIAAVETDRCRREPGQATANAQRQLARIGAAFDRSGAAVISGASGVADPTREERGFLDSLGLPARAAGTAIGHGFEPAFIAHVALAAAAIERGRLFAPLEEAEAAMDAPLRQVLVTSWGHWRGEAMALVTAP
ncbi:MAG: beta-ketoacyl-ACP synthase, partial [Acetobacteraceae bacterium]